MWWLLWEDGVRCFFVDFEFFLVFVLLLAFVLVVKVMFGCAFIELVLFILDLFKLILFYVFTFEHMSWLWNICTGFGFNYTVAVVNWFKLFILEFSKGLVVFFDFERDPDVLVLFFLSMPFVVEVGCISILFVYSYFYWFILTYLAKSLN